MKVASSTVPSLERKRIGADGGREDPGGERGLRGGGREQHETPGPGRPAAAG